MRPFPAILLPLLASAGVFTSCTVAKKETGALALQPLIAPPISEDAAAALKAIADSPGAQLPPHLASTSEKTLETPDSPANVSLDTAVSITWRAPGRNPDEVNPGDIYSENNGPFLRKAFSLLDELPPAERNPLLGQFARSTTERVPVTLSRSELAQLETQVEEGTVLPTRSVALDLRTEVHTLDPDRHAALLDRIARGESGGAIAPAERLRRLRKDLESVKKRLRSGERLHLVTTVSESAVVRATYPGAPVGHRDAEPIRNAVQAHFPHLRPLQAERKGDAIEITGDPRLLWKFESRELKLDGDKILIVETVVAGL